MDGPAAKQLFQMLRSRARDAALQVLYQDDLNPQISPAVGDSMLGERFPMWEIERIERQDLVSLACHAFPDRSPAAISALPPEELAGEVRSQAVEFARQLVDGVRRNRQQLDERIARVAENWSLERMAATDRNVLRIGAYELFYSDTPPHAAIDEAVELAKRYGSAQSGPFVNGILDKLTHEKGQSIT